MARQRSSEGGGGSASSSTSGAINSRRFHFSRQNGMTPLS
jgi:hypothetical protein